MYAFESPAPSAVWTEPEFVGKLAFLRCKQDQAIPLFLQDMFVQRSGVEWMVKDIEAGHSPWASQPKEVMKSLEECTVVFLEAGT